MTHLTFTSCVACLLHGVLFADGARPGPSESSGELQVKAPPAPETPAGATMKIFPFAYTSECKGTPAVKWGNLGAWKYNKNEMNKCKKGMTGKRWEQKQTCRTQFKTSWKKTCAQNCLEQEEDCKFVVLKDTGNGISCTAFVDCPRTKGIPEKYKPEVWEKSD